MLPGHLEHAYYLALIGVIPLAVACARQTKAAEQIQAKGVPASLVELALEADAVQPERATLVLRASGCRSGAIQVRRSSPDTYEWTQGSRSDTWNTRDEFRFNVQAASGEWNSCMTLDLYFGCMAGVDTEVGATAECGDSILARRPSEGPITLLPTVHHDN